MSTFLTVNQSPIQWTALLVRKLWLVVFDMWDHRCKILHKNDLYDKIQKLDEIDHNIRSLLRKDILEVYPHKRRVFCIISAAIFSQIPKFRRE